MIQSSSFAGPTSSEADDQLERKSKYPATREIPPDCSLCTSISDLQQDSRPELTIGCSSLNSYISQTIKIYPDTLKWRPIAWIDWFSLSTQAIWTFRHVIHKPELSKPACTVNTDLPKYVKHYFCWYFYEMQRFLVNCPTFLTYAENIV